ncbi:FAD-dependent oxidoreductase [Clostridium kluyveri]|uniref:NADH:flavin oxidoreductase n=1 Tax=Clostridium kluyveri TaxID=1534 RepID=A0A1L5F539_CLOKL|nr:FAD-dependent oxidoreductase [Clostridium kluyveri]APM38136.1 NADH:flavin oxidoreductase [Clostridium kluyveri]UZQ51855.1 NAD(P)/FAD-dependent oxidoreductase [Clostridium kluyveri]
MDDFYMNRIQDMVKNIMKDMQNSEEQSIYKNLFSKGKIGSLELKNRIVMTPMENCLNNKDATVSDEMIAFYVERAKGGIGLIITEVTRVNDENGVADRQQLSAAHDKYIPGLKKLADAVHENGGKIFIQLHHPGRQGFSEVNGNKPMMAPSRTQCNVVHQETREMTTKEAEGLVQDFINAACRVKAAGIDGVEVHGAHGYLINQFLSPYTNKRTDKYGGSFENRIRFIEEIVIGIREKCGQDYPVIARLSVDEFLRTKGIEDGILLKDGVKIAKHLEKIGVDAIDVSAGIYETMNVSWEPTSFPQGWKLYLAEEIKKSINIPVISAAVIREAAYADKIIGEGRTDFVGSARLHFADPEWSNKARENRAYESRLCISCLHCIETLFSGVATGNPIECSINIQAGKEFKYCNMKKNGDGRVVVILGAGPSGLEAARVLAMRKFKPIIFEKSDRIGGQLNLANKPPKKEKISWLINYLQLQVHKLGVEIRLNKIPTIDEIKKLSPYAVFVAEGSSPIIPESINGIHGKNVFTIVDVLSGKTEIYNKKAAVIGSGMTGLETAEFLASKNNDVTVFEMGDNIGPGVFFQNLTDVQERLKEHNVKMITKHKLISIKNNTAVFELLSYGEIKEYYFDYIIISLGTSSNKDLIDEISSNFYTVRVIGDAKNPGRIRNAMETGFESAYNL